MHSTLLHEKRVNVKVRRAVSLCTTGRWTCFCLLVHGVVSERLLVDEATNISDVAKSYHKDNLLLAAGVSTLLVFWVAGVHQSSS